MSSPAARALSERASSSPRLNAKASRAAGAARVRSILSKRIVCSIGGALLERTADPRETSGGGSRGHRRQQLGPRFLTICRFAFPIEAWLNFLSSTQLEPPP